VQNFAFEATGFEKERHIGHQKHTCGAPWQPTISTNLV